MTQRVNAQFAGANFVVSQVKDREQRLKKEYNAVKSICSKSGFSWDNNLLMATTTDGVWDELPENLQKWKNKQFPYYDDLHEIYNGKIAEGKHCRRSSETANKNENKILEDDYREVSTPSPTIPVTQSFVELVQGGIDLSTEDGLDFEINGSQYREMVEEETDRQAHEYSHSQADLTSMQEKQKRKARAADCASTEIPVRQEREKKKSKRNDNGMDELIALRKEELEAYKELTESSIKAHTNAAE